MLSRSSGPQSVHARERPASLLPDEMAGGCPREPGRGEHGRVKGEFVGTDWRVGALSRGVSRPPLPLIPAFWK